VATLFSFSKSSLHFCPKIHAALAMSGASVPSLSSKIKIVVLKGHVSIQITLTSLDVWRFCPSLSSKDQNTCLQSRCSVQKHAIAYDV
jgi:hypothetical protein